MKSENNPVKLKQTNNADAMPLLFLVLVAALICCFGKANAQRGNQSDWNVPPPLAPGTITKGDIEGRSGTTGTAALIFTDVAPAIQPALAGVVLELPPISTTPPEVNRPERPVADNVLAGLPDIPLPNLPELPVLPDLTLQDLAEPPVTNMPMPATPDMPSLPAEPATSGGPNTPKNNGLLPLMPAVRALPISFSGPPAETIMWPTPSIPPNLNLN